MALVARNRTGWRRGTKRCEIFISPRRSGFLEKAELVQWLQIVERLGGMSPEVVAHAPVSLYTGAKRTTAAAVADGLMHEFDANHDNKISREEFKQFGGQLHVEKAFARLNLPRYSA